MADPGACTSAGWLDTTAPRICMVGAVDRVDDDVLRLVARLHFNWLAVATAADRYATPDFDGLGALRMRAERYRLNVLADLDVQGLDRSAFADLAHIGTRLGQVAHGIRAVGAHRFPAPRWRELIGATPGTVWFADTLGATEDETARVLEAGFGFYFSSVRWWDTREPWALAQYERFRLLARSVGFPEAFGGASLRTELAPVRALENIKQQYRLRYAVAAFFGAGLAMPLGYERAEVAAIQGNSAAPAAQDAIDLRPTITAINRIKANHPELGVEHLHRRLLAGSTLVLAKLDGAGTPASCFICNASGRGVTLSLADTARSDGIDLSVLRDVTPATAPRILDRAFWLGPYEWRIFVRPQPIEAERGESAAMRAAKSAQVNGRRATSTSRIVIEDVEPEIDAGRFPAKRVVADRIEVSADIYRDGHEVCAASLLIRPKESRSWTAVPMLPHENDRWFAVTTATANGCHCYCIEAWRDNYASWFHAVAAKYDAGQDIAIELVEGRALLAAAAQRAIGEARSILNKASAVPPPATPLALQLDRLCTADAQAAMARWGPRTDVTRYPRELELTVDRRAACFSTWYEMFPRSQGKEPGRSAIFADCIARLDAVAAMGFDVVYLPPIHPIGTTNRKGHNNALVAAPGDPGSPYAIGSAEGGHGAIEPGLGTLADFRAFVAACRQRGMEVALDFAVQCSPDHPWITEHPEWFEFRPDGTIRFAENPPKKYQDIVNMNLRGDGPIELWQALRDVLLFWIEQGVAIFRVDNPHTKPFPFWTWLIREIQREHPEVIFLAEAFTRPKPLKQLAKLGFTQSYTYFTWRNTKQELVDYFTELTQTETREYLRPNLFTNTPDILPGFLQRGGPAAFRIRVALAATLSSIYGIYNGFELCEARALPDSEEYLDSEKYEYKTWDWDRPANIKSYITALNRARARNVALQDWRNLTFLSCSSEQVLFFAKWAPSRAEHVFAAISLDPLAPQIASIDLPLSRLEIGDQEPFTVENLLNGDGHQWLGPQQRVSLNPQEPAFLFRVGTSSASSA